MSEDRELTEETTAPHLLKVAGVGMAALLALSACTSMETADGDAEEETQDQAEENGEADAAPEEDEAPEEAEVPDFEDIAENMFDAMEAQDNVTVVGRGEIWDDEFDDIADEDIEDVEQSFTMIGDLDGETTHMEMEYGSDSMGMLVTEDEVFMSGEFFATVIRSQAEEYGEDDLVDWDALESDLEGMWIDLTDDLDPGDADEFSVGELFADMREGYEDSAEDDDFFGSFGGAPEGELDEVDGQEVWVYAEDEVEIVVQADEEEPLLVAINGVDDDGVDYEMSFENWNRSEVEPPANSEIMTESDFEDLLMDHADDELFE